MYKNIIMFSLGALIGSVATYFIVKDHFEDIAEEEIESVKEVYKRVSDSKEKVEKLNETKREMATEIFGKSYDEAVEKLGYQTNYNVFSKKIPEEKIEEELEMMPEDHPSEDIPGLPYTISPDMFVNDKKYFDKITLEYYEGNDILVEEISGEPVDIDDAIGRDSLRMFGEFEKDLVYVRNERLATDYEVYHYSGSYIEK